MLLVTVTKKNLIDCLCKSGRDSFYQKSMICDEENIKKIREESLIILTKK